MDNPVISWLFDTDALRVCPEGQPFWYTSGKMGPFYINTHFLCGGEAQALALLTDIEAAALQPLELPSIIGDKLDALAQADARYGALIAKLVDLARAAQAAEGFDMVSGGERRDFFFSLPVARALGLPHLSIFKDLSAVYTDAEGRTVPAAEAALQGKRALHVVDLVTEASSYFRAWIPAQEALGSRIVYSLAVVDRDQGGREKLAEADIPLRTLVKVDGSLFEYAVAQGKLTAAQGEMAQAFLADPDAFMRDFLRAHPDYLQRQIALGGKAKERAERCIELGFDRMGSDKLGSDKS